MYAICLHGPPVNHPWPGSLGWPGPTEACLLGAGLPLMGYGASISCSARREPGLKQLLEKLLEDYEDDCPTSGGRGRGRMQRLSQTPGRSSGFCSGRSLGC